MTPETVITNRYRSLHEGFLESSRRFPERPALQVGGELLSFRDLSHRALMLAATLQRRAPQAGPPLAAVFGARSTTAFAGVLGALLSGRGYVPLNPAFPPSRTRSMLQRADCRAVIVDNGAVALLDEVLPGVIEHLLLVLPEHADVASLANRWPAHEFIGANELTGADAWRPPTVGPDEVAYLLFTSGSTGVPKGVAVAQRNVRALVDILVARYGITEQDRFSQTFDFTFDLSVFDMFVAWERGACVCCPTPKALLSPARFIRDSRLTVWFSVPSIGVNMKRIRLLKPNQYPGLRWSLFCGEPLPIDVAQAWAASAPRSIVENLYGPTELTVACTFYRWNRADPPVATDGACVPIGYPFVGMKCLVVDDELEPVRPGVIGELLMTGPQLTLGYWKDADRTAAAFVVPPGQRELYYRTGDLVRRPVGDAPILYVGRCDSQVKVNGYRVELGEVEAALRAAGEVDAAVVVPWPRTPSGAGGLFGLLQGSAVSLEAVRARLKAALPPYMVPRELQVLGEFPLNANGKIDRQQLLRLVEGLYERYVG